MAVRKGHGKKTQVLAFIGRAATKSLWFNVISVVNGFMDSVLVRKNEMRLGRILRVVCVNSVMCCIYVSESDILGPIDYLSDIENSEWFESAMFADYSFKYRT